MSTSLGRLSSSVDTVPSRSASLRSQCAHWLWQSVFPCTRKRAMASPRWGSCLHFSQGSWPRSIERCTVQKIKVFTSVSTGSCTARRAVRTWFNSPSIKQRQPTLTGELPLFWWRWGELTSAAAEAGSQGKRAAGTFSDTAPVQLPLNKTETAHPDG